MYKFMQNTKGNVAIMLALSAVPLILLIGFFIDFGKQETQEQETVAALDFAVLAAAKELQQKPSLSDAELKAIAQTVFDAEINVPSDTTYEQLDLRRMNEDEVIISVKGTVDTSIMGIIGFDTLPLNAESGAGVGATSPLEMVLVADVSNSMEGPGIAALRDAADAMLNELYSGLNPDVKVGLVPFNQHANIGTDISGSWLEIPPDETLTFTRCTVDMDATIAQGCTIQQRCDASSFVGGGKENCRSDIVCPSGITAVETCRLITEDRTFFGCVRSRQPHPANIQDSNYGNIPVVGELLAVRASCREENTIVPLTDNPQLIRSALNRAIPDGNTYIPTGLIWGHRVLSPIAPYSQSTQPISNQAIVLLSDGANTRSVSGLGSHFGMDADEANDVMIEVCDEIKAAGITIYTIDFNIDDNVTEQLLEDCATSDDHNFEANSATQLRNTFMVISGRFSEITLTR